VTLKIVSITLAGVEIAGNKYFSDDNIRASVPGIRAGITPEQRTLSAALEMANTHPSKQIVVRLRESEQSDAVDAIIDVKDQRPWKLFAGLNNIGTKKTKRTRATIGGQHTNLFNRDHSMTVSYTTSPENQRNVMQAGASYELPLYAAKGRLSAFFSESDVNVGEIAGFQVSGAGRFIGLSFTRILGRLGAYSHEWNLGLQDRFFESTVDFVVPGFRIPIGNNVRSYPVTVGYKGKYEAAGWIGDFGVDYSRNLGVGKRNDVFSYAAARGGADPDWDAVRFNANLNYFLPKNWLLRTQLNGQWTNEPLISGEQFGLGGERSIRGLDERSVLGDSGYRVGVEIWTPPIPKTFGLRLLTFVDFGMLERVGEDEVNNDTVSSAGLGLRWQWRTNLSVNLDYGHTIDGGERLTANGEDAAGVKWHFNVFYSF
jgi:hemolysin activation/secretion protein